MPATDYFEQLLLDYALRQQPFSVSDWYVGLWLADPTSSGSLVSEVGNAEYERRSVLWSTSFTNSNEIVFPVPITSWGAVTHVALLNSPLKGSGNMLSYGPHSAQIDAGERPRIQVGQLSLTIV